MIWDISPIAFKFQIFDFKVQVHWYGLFFASALAYGILIFRYIYPKEGKPKEDVYDMMLYFMAGTVIGARLGHVLFYNPVFYLTHPLKILAVWEGGLASHGAMLGILTSTWLYTRSKTDQSYLWLLDRMGMTVPISGVLIRIGNFFNSEILGLPTDMPWGVVFARIDSIPRHPVQLYESFCYLLIFFIQLKFYFKHSTMPPPGQLLGRFFIMTFGIRFFLEFFKTEQAAFADGWFLTMGQLLSIPAVGLGILILYLSKRFAMFGIK